MKRPLHLARVCVCGTMIVVCMAGAVASPAAEPASETVDGRGDFVWIEGELPQQHNFTKHTWYDDVKRGKLSAVDWLSNYGEKPATARYDFTVRKGGEYTWWLRCNPVASQMEYRLDDGPAKPIDLGKPHQSINLVDALDHRFIAWVKVGTLRLDSGKHALHVTINSKLANSGAVDCMALVGFDWTPDGIVRPDGKGGQAAKDQGGKPSKVPPEMPKDTSQFGAHIQRTMTLLATSTPERRRRVRILVYGQSISEQDWWKEVARDLRERFPHADLEIQNKAIGGFASQMLVRTAEQDLYPFYPDLLIFHVFGAHDKYEDIIRRTRSRTTAEIAMWTDHLGADEKPNANGYYENQGWTAFMANFLPATAKKYGCELIEIREPWKRYLKQHNLRPAVLLIDGIHLNEFGNYLLAELIKRQLVHNPKLRGDAWKDLVRSYEVGKDVSWKDGKLVLEFDGNRIDALAGKPGAAKAADLRVSIDGKSPSEFAGCYAFTRTSGAAGTWGPGIYRISSQRRRLVEEWTVRVTAADKEAKTFRFDLIGSKTGPDGSGASNEDFVSKSGRVAIKADDWRMPGNDGLVPVGFEVKWRCAAMFVDRYEPPPVDDPSRQYPTTLAQGLDNGKHTLELIVEGGGDPPAIEEIRVYRPPLK